MIFPETSGNTLRMNGATYTSEAKNDPLPGGNVFANDDYLKITTRRVVRGGSWGGSVINLRVTYRDSHRPNDPKAFVGFRCAKS